MKMAYTQEPEIVQGKKPESALQLAIKKEIKSILDHKKSANSLIEYFILEKFGLDIVVFLRWNDDIFTIRYFELKAFMGSRPGGVGFGTRSGGGPQVEMLLLEDQNFKLTQRFIRWILIDGTKPKGTTRYALFDNRQAKQSAMGSVRKGKQNNLRVNDLMKNALNWNMLSKAIEHFLIQKK